MEPTFFKTVGRHHANNYSFGLAQCRMDIPDGEFGYVGKNWCDDCGRGFDDDLEYHMTYRQTWEQPEEGIEVCPHCGSENAGENQQDHDLRLVKRFSVKLIKC